MQENSSSIKDRKKSPSKSPSKSPAGKKRSPLPPTKLPPPSPTFKLPPPPKSLSDCTLSLHGNNAFYSKCYNTTEAEAPIDLFFNQTTNGIQVALRLLAPSSQRWVAWSLQGPYGGMYNSDAIFAFPCSKSSTGACVDWFNLGTLYTAAGFSQLNPQNVKFIENPTAFLEPNGDLILQLSLEWLPSYGQEMKAIFSHGPYSGEGWKAFHEHEQEDPPHLNVNKSGDIQKIYY